MKPFMKPQTEGARMLRTNDAEFIVDLGDRLTKNNEFVQLKLTPSMANKVKLDADDVYLSVKTQINMLENKYDDKHLSTEVHVHHQEGPYTITVTGQLAYDLLELDNMTIYQTMGYESADVDVELLDEYGNTYKSDRKVWQPRKADDSKFRFFIDLPKEIGNKSDDIREATYNRCVRIVQIFFSDAANVYSTIALTRLGLTRPRIVFFIKMPEHVDFKTYLTCYHEIHSLKIIDLSDLGFMHPALGKLDSAIRDTLGVQNCCLRPKCISDGSRTCTLMDSYYDARRKRKAEEMLKDKQQTYQEKFNQASQSIQEKMNNNKSIVCRAFNLGRCGKDRFCQNYGGHGDATAAKKIKCASADEPGDMNYHHKKSKCAYTTETCIYYGHVDKI